MRQRLNLPVPPNWKSQGAQPELPAVSLPPALVAAIARSLADSGMRLPNRDECQRLARVLGNSLWCEHANRQEAVGGAAAPAAWLALVTSDAANLSGQ